jgi:C4-dicarboxylate-specific signal transduction histidine kinase
MLGRQQIAGIPTAISELFKNAHDAYADSVEVDFYRSDGLLVLRDDGLGMTRKDFESRWLTLGTESKLDANTGIGLPPVDPRKPKRPILGEKGIGRLAIGAIGPQVLVLTRAQRNGKLQELIAAFVQWSLFQCPGIDLDQIEVPVSTFPGGTLPSRTDVKQMVQSVRKNLIALKPQLVQQTFEGLLAELDKFVLDPEEIDSWLGEPSLRGKGTGTHFYVLPADASLIAAIDEKAENDSVPPLRKMLLGFTNTMTPGHPVPRIKTAFRDHKTNDNAEELIAEQGFFTPEEFANADHHIQGHFDEYGQFSGLVSVYGEDHKDHVVAWDAAHGRKTECGPFQINVAYVQGISSESTLPPEEWTRLTRKLNQIGGMYIYKDDIRILPYGNTDYDFLEIEKNRTKSAGYYYFSYRRMFGVVEISQQVNPQLSEKAGREGFRENKAYREFRAILMNFFVQIAADFFREGSASAERYIERKAELDRVEQARRQREKQLTTRRATFNRQLQSYFKDVESGKPEEEVSLLVQSLEAQVRSATKIKDRDEASRSLISVEAAAIRSLEELRRRYRVARPNGVGLSKQLRRDWESSVVETRRLEDETFLPARNRIAQIVGDLAAKAKLDVSLRLRLERSITEQIVETQKRAAVERKDTKVALEVVNTEVNSITRQIVHDLDNAISEVRTELARLDLSGMKEAAIVEKRDGLESKLTLVAERNLNALNSIQEDLRALHWSRDEQGGFVGMSAMNESMQEELLAMRDRAEADIELTQLGMAINVVNHEFENSIKSVRGNLRRLKSWVDVNDNLRPLYTDLRASFDHIDGYLSLFTPLQRRLYRTAIDISGSDIAKFLQDLFGPRLERHSVELRSTRSFLRYKVTGFPSSFYPVFVNLVDNALFWVKDRPQPRFIQLDVQNECMLVADSGPGIPERDRDAVFELGFTRKPAGRGMGLYISREALAKVGYKIDLEPSSPNSGATFRIEPIESNPKT